MQKKVEVYGATWCSHCNRLTAWLRENSIEFEYKNIELKEHQEEIEARNPKGIPFTVINGSVFVTGFNQQELSSILFN